MGHLTASDIWLRDFWPLTKIKITEDLSNHALIRQFFFANHEENVWILFFNNQCLIVWHGNWTHSYGCMIRKRAFDNKVYPKQMWLLYLCIGNLLIKKAVLKFDMKEGMTQSMRMRGRHWIIPDMSQKVHSNAPCHGLVGVVKRKFSPQVVGIFFSPLLLTSYSPQRIVYTVVTIRWGE